MTLTRKGFVALLLLPVLAPVSALAANEDVDRLIAAMLSDTPLIGDLDALTDTQRTAN